MAVGVVDGFEVVHVDHQQVQPAHVVVELIVDEAGQILAVIHLGQLIHGNLLAVLIISLVLRVTSNNKVTLIIHSIISCKSMIKLYR